MTNAEALETTLEALPGLSDEDTALVTHARTLAAQIDLWPTETKLHSEYREVLRRVTAAGQAAETDRLAELLEELRS